MSEPEIKLNRAQRRRIEAVAHKKAGEAALAYRQKTYKAYVDLYTTLALNEARRLAGIAIDPDGFEYLSALLGEEE